jgi:hypothetical protein
MRPELYFEKCFTENTLDALPFGVLCHAFDEYFDWNCTEIKLTAWENAFTIRYNVGIPLSIRYDDLTNAELVVKNWSMVEFEKVFCSRPGVLQ